MISSRRWLLLGAVGALTGCLGSGDDSSSAVPAQDASAIDATTGASDACVPEAGARCSSCATPASDPYNACSPFVGACIPFDAARVPAHPTL